MHEVTVAVVDDHRLFREGLTALLSADARIGVGGSGTDGFDAMKLAGNPLLDVMLLGTEVGGISVLDVMTEIARLAPNLKVIILAKSSELTLMGELLQRGASGYFVKNVEIEEITAAIIAASRGMDGFVSLKIPRSEFLFTYNAVPASTAELVSLLSQREEEILALVAKAQSNAQIGRELFIAEATVKRHLSNIFRKLGAVSRMDAVQKISPSKDRKFGFNELKTGKVSEATKDSSAQAYEMALQQTFLSSGP
ncbi:response regulator transcription factor [Arthrobacter sp. ZGTC212]|uniref:response regulator transcription factor n=1 Tax=Arthrobacter sp. ZGTC212 TaxID=2058899 RepID=UPI000CE533E9|nr:response regulator transcription factor [Arthrobacter sp. ZGTC212]